MGRVTWRFSIASVKSARKGFAGPHRRNRLGVTAVRPWPPTKWGRIRQWTALPRDKRQSMEQIAAYAKTAAQQNENAFVHSRRDPYEKIMGWLLPRAGRPY